jgi:hypothetical protein
VTPVIVVPRLLIVVAAFAAGLLLGLLWQHAAPVRRGWRLKLMFVIPHNKHAEGILVGQDDAGNPIPNGLENIRNLASSDPSVATFEQDPADPTHVFVRPAASANLPQTCQISCQASPAGDPAVTLSLLEDITVSQSEATTIGLGLHLVDNS